jgi:hypothetical protein
LSAQVSAWRPPRGAAADAKYGESVLVCTIAKGGRMLEASIGAGHSPSSRRIDDRRMSRSSSDRCHRRGRLKARRRLESSAASGRVGNVLGIALLEEMFVRSDPNADRGSGE